MVVVKELVSEVLILAYTKPPLLGRRWQLLLAVKGERR